MEILSLSRVPRKMRLGVPPLLLLLLLLLLINDASRVTAQSLDDGYTEYCSMASVKLDRSLPISDSEQELRRLIQPFQTGDAEIRKCPSGMVCAQKFVSIQDVEAKYSEECWERSSIIEYVEVSCYSDFCNTNITFGQLPSLTRRYFQSGGRFPIKCYNHGQLRGMSTYRQILSPSDFQFHYAHSAPVSRWTRGMCGAAIYTSIGRSYITHERVLTGDREQKFAILRICPRTGCNRQVVKDYLRSGYRS